MTTEPEHSSGPLRAGDRHYRAYVGPPERYDLISALSFNLFTGFLGLREHHRLLDIGCGSLRNGRLLIPYLAPSHYFGLEPERWLVAEGIAHECGQDQIAVKRPTFLYADDWPIDRFGVQFDYVLAQSIFSHASLPQIRECLARTAACLHEGSVCAATFMVGHADYTGTDWVYPGLVAYTLPTIQAVAEASGLIALRTRFAHPKQSWYLMGLPGAQPQLREMTDNINRCAGRLFPSL